MQRNLWLDLAGITFKIHRSFAISIVLINAILFFINYKLKYRYQFVNFLCGVVFLEVLSGVILTYFDMLALMQPIHLIAASLLFLLQIALYFQLQKAKSN
ncbi:MAG: heme A synthase, partial [Bacteroidetes bacterium MED-G21]